MGVPAERLIGTETNRSEGFPDQLPTLVRRRGETKPTERPNDMAMADAIERTETSAGS